MIIVGGLELLDTAFSRSAPLMAQFESGGSCCYASRFLENINVGGSESQNML